MSSLEAGVRGYVAALFSTFVLYPYRDYIKVVDLRSMPRVDPLQYCLLRYKGMLLNPSQPLLLALPWGFLYTGFAIGSGSVTGAVCAGAFHAVGKVSVRTIARRLGGPRSRYDEMVYRSLFHCLRQSMKQYGFLSFFSGVSATALISTLWHALSLVALESSNPNGFFEAWWSAFRVHSFLTFATNPLRNVLRSALHSTERAEGVRSISSFLAGEAAVYREAVGVLKSMLRTEGIAFFFNGVLRTTCKSSVPFGFVFALFFSSGGSLPGHHGGWGGKNNHHHHHHMPVRRFV